MYGKFTEAAAARSVAEAQLADLEERHGEVKANVENFSTDRGLEGAVRERYGVARPGEGQIDIVRQSSTTPVNGSPVSLWDRLWDLLFVW